MRHLALTLLFFCCITACKYSVKGANGKVYKSPVEYNDYIISRQTDIVNNVTQLLRVMETDLDSANNLLKKFAMELDTVIIDIKGMPAYKGDSTLRNAAVNSFGFYQRMFAHEYQQLIDIRKSGNAQTQEGMAEMNRILGIYTKEDEMLDKAFHTAQTDFALKNRMRLMENDRQKEIDKLGK